MLRFAFVIIDSLPHSVLNRSFTLMAARFPQEQLQATGIYWQRAGSIARRSLFR